MSSGSILGWFGFNKSDEPALPDTAAKIKKRDERSILMGNITEFLKTNDLAVTSANLEVAHRAFSGLDAYLLHRIEMCAVQGERVSQQWLDDFSTTKAEEASNDSLERLMVKLGNDLEAFSKSAKEAHLASAIYGEELAQHASELEQVANTGTIVTDLAKLAKVMLERTRKVEGEMRRSESEARKLRTNLAEARLDAELDHLTGLPNRRAFELLLDNQYRSALSSAEPLSVAFCDIDHFKKVNDVHGHDTGDRVLKAIARELARISNDHCHVARHGGEEFVMLFQGMTPSEARHKIDDVRERLARRNFVNRKTDARIGTITFSGGVADVFGYPDARSALAAADGALYRAKNDGRNRIFLAEG